MSWWSLTREQEERVYAAQQKAQEAYWQRKQDDERALKAAQRYKAWLEASLPGYETGAVPEYYIDPVSKKRKRGKPRALTPEERNQEARRNSPIYGYDPAVGF